MYKKSLIFLSLLFLIFNKSIGQTHTIKVNKELHACEMFNKEGNFIKVLKLPLESAGFPIVTEDNKYLIDLSVDKENWYQINIETNETKKIHFPPNASALARGSFYADIYYNDNKLYLNENMFGRNYNPTEHKKTSETTIFMLDFEKQTFSKYLTIPLSDDQYCFNPSFIGSDTIILTSNSGKIKKISLGSQEVISESSIDIPAEWNDISNYTFSSLYVCSELVHFSYFNYSNERSKKGFFINLNTNEIVNKYEFVDTTTSHRVLLPTYNCLNNELYFYSVRQENSTLSTIKLYNKHDIYSPIFEITGRLFYGHYISPEEPNVFVVKYNSGKLEYYNIVTKQLIKTEESTSKGF